VVLTRCNTVGSVASVSGRGSGLAVAVVRGVSPASGGDDCTNPNVVGIALVGLADTV